jgi:hypothetical protein
MFFPNKPCHLSWRNMYLSKENSLCQKQRIYSTLFPVRTQLVFERNTACNIGFSRFRQAIFLPNRPFHPSWKNTCISQIKPIVSEAALSNTLFPVRIELVYERDYSKVQICFLCSQYAYLAMWKKHIYVSKKTIYDISFNI